MKIKTFVGGLMASGMMVSLSVAKTQVGPVELGGQFRVRYEVADPINLANTTEQTTQDLLLFRTRVWGKTEIPEKKIKVYLQIQDSRVSGSEPSVAANTGNVDLKQGYVDILDLGGKNLHLRVGRQELKYGDQRLISPLDWSNVGRSWDGVKFFTEVKKTKLEAFYTIITEVNDVFQDQKFSGVYTNTPLDKTHELDVYTFWRHSGEADTTTGNGGSLNINQITPGVRFAGKADRFDYKAEGLVQVGDTAGQDIKAGAFAGVAGYTFEAKTQPRVGLGYELASGDDNPTDNESNTFDPLFPFGHYYQGHADVFSFKNSNTFLANVTLKPAKTWWMQVAYHNFRLAEATDAWFGASGAPIAQDITGSSGKEVGQEIDIHFKTTFRDFIKIWFGYARFWGGRFAKRNVTHPDKDFAFVQGTLNF